MDSARGVLNVAEFLVYSKHEAYQETGLQTVLNVFNLFNDRIMSLKNSHSITNKAVDLAKEDRVAKADAIIDVLLRIISNPQFIKAKDSDRYRLRELATNLDTDLDYFSVRLNQVK